jgi:hypothetical protein
MAYLPFVLIVSTLNRQAKLLRDLNMEGNFDVIAVPHKIFRANKRSRSIVQLIRGISVFEKQRNTVLQSQPDGHGCDSANEQSHPRQEVGPLVAQNSDWAVADDECQDGSKNHRKDVQKNFHTFSP